MAEQRGLVAPEPEPVLEPVEEPEPFAPPRPSLGERLRASFRRLAASMRSLAAELRRPGGTRIRLAFIALIAAAAGAGAVIGIEASSPSSASAGSGAGHAWLGVELGSPIGQAGAAVEFVVPGGPADESGIELGDVITAIDGRAISGPADAVAAIAALRPGDSAQVALDRFGQPLSLRITLGREVGAGP